MSEEKQNYFTIKEDGVYEVEIKKSRFIASFKRVKSEEEAKDFINGIKKENWKANHNCSSFILGKNMEIQRSSDDGEPSGTAGIPMLEVLKKNELIDLVVVVTRYFGGIKLGAGGLIRAYSGTVADGVKEIGIVKGVLRKEVLLNIDYANHGKIQNFLENNPEYSLADTIYSDKVLVKIMVDENEVDDFSMKMVDLLNGQVEITTGMTKYDEIAIN
jgi:uncharacterized YigZ family protein